MYETEANKKPIEAGLFLLRIWNRFYRLISKKKRGNMIINEEVMTNYLEQIVLLLNEILDVSSIWEV
jgi:hypothetical protein